MTRDTMSVNSPSGVRSKIGQMPGELRLEINRRLRAGEDYLAIAAWMNARPDVRAVLKQCFRGAPISPANLSEWRRKGGYAEWLRQQEEVQRRVAPAMLAAGTARAAVAAAPPQESLRVESAISGKTAGERPVLVLTINGIAAQISEFSTQWLVRGLVRMEGGPPHAPTRLTFQGRTPAALRGYTDDVVIVELCRRLLFDYRQGTLVTGPRKIPTPDEAARSRWIINPQKDTIRREGGVTA